MNLDGYRNAIHLLWTDWSRVERDNGVQFPPSIGHHQGQPPAVAETQCRYPAGDKLQGPQVVECSIDVAKLVGLRMIGHRSRNRIPIARARALGHRMIDVRRQSDKS